MKQAEKKIRKSKRTNPMTDFEVLQFERPELVDPRLPEIDTDFGDKVLRIINAAKAAQ